MIPNLGHTQRRKARRDLLQQYARLQRELLDGDPSAPSYHGTLHAFRQMGFVLISSGMEEDLDRMLRLRVLTGGRERPAAREERSRPRSLKLVR